MNTEIRKNKEIKGFSNLEKTILKEQELIIQEKKRSLIEKTKQENYSWLISIRNEKTHEQNISLVRNKFVVKSNSNEFDLLELYAIKRENKKPRFGIRIKKHEVYLTEQEFLKVLEDSLVAKSFEIIQEILEENELIF